MNKLILLSAVLFFTLRMEAQSIKGREVPANLSSKVSELYPDVSKTDWEMVDGLYEISFVSKGVETSLLLSRDATLVLTETAIEISALPGKIKGYITQHHPTSGISEASKTVDLTGKVSYEVEADGIEYLFSEMGEYLSQKVEGEEDDDDDDK
jgi:hypothetical protein